MTSFKGLTPLSVGRAPKPFSFWSVSVGTLMGGHIGGVVVGVPFVLVGDPAFRLEFVTGRGGKMYSVASPAMKKGILIAVEP